MHESVDARDDAAARHGEDRRIVTRAEERSGGREAIEDPGEDLALGQVADDGVRGAHPLTVPTGGAG